MIPVDLAEPRVGGGCHLRGLRKRLALLEASDPRGQPFVKKLKALAQDIKLQEICAYLRQYLEGEEP